MKKFLLFILGFLFLTACSVIKTYDEIDYNKLDKMLKAKDNFVLFVNSDSCSECKKYEVTLNKIIDRYNIDVKAVNLSLLSKKEKTSFVSIISVSDTPSLVFVEKGVEKDRIAGNVKYSKILEKFKENNYIKE